MKPVHEKLPVSTFEEGSTYTFSLNGNALYSANVIKFHGGCWATVRIAETKDPSLATTYRPGMEFDVKVAQYEIAAD